MAGRKPGTPKTGGRQKGSVNKTTAIAKDMIAEVANRLGGAERMLAWVQLEEKNEAAFWTSIYPKLLPLQVSGEGEGGAVIVEIARRIIR